MAGGGSSKSNPPSTRKRVDAGTSSGSPTTSLVRAKDGSAFALCDECSKNVPLALINFHNCSLDARIKMTLEAQIVEKPAEVKKKPEEKRKAKSLEPKAKKAKSSNGAKRPPSSFILFMSDFRKSYKEANPDCKSVSVVAKEGGEKWKSMSAEDKKVYSDKAAELKSEYEKTLKKNESDDPENEDDEGQSSEKEVQPETISDDE